MIRNNHNHQNSKNEIEQDIKREFTYFIQSYDGGYYQAEIRKLISMGKSQNVLLIKNEHLLNYNADVAFTIFQEYYKYERVLNSAFTALMKEIEKQQGLNEDFNSRQESMERYFVAFESGIDGVNQPGISIRQLVCSKIGRLQKLIGTVTRTTQVRPQLVVGVFKCRNCNRLSKQIEQQFKYTQPKKCLNDNCDSKAWELDLSRSIFADFQQLRVQQDPNTIPAGGMPRSINIILRNYNVEKAQPGDICKFVGYLCVTPQISSMLKPGQRTTLTTRNLQTRGNTMQMQGIKGVSGIRELNYKLVFIASHVIIQNKQFNDIDSRHQQQQDPIPQQNMEENQKQKYNSQKIYDKLFSQYTQTQVTEISQLRSNPRLYEDLADSLFPGIFGHSEIKKAILLQLFGGVHKITRKNKINIRGDINILLVGDPSTAKSQFLKTINKFVTRSVYTNGKTTSAAGLTASVVRDDQGNVGIEAGALMLADNGICCIDQFDKMDLTDMTAIHEAMQQQTISIAKAGVHATLNARASILAAANPVFGRYDKTKNLQRNINISPPIMSRFDLYFVICDESNIEADRNLCDFIVSMHREKQNVVHKRYNPKTLRFYINIAKKIKPMLNNDAAQKLRQCYINVRKNCRDLGLGASYLATVRQLQSMIRLSQALAKLHLDLQVTGEHVMQAYRLIQNSITKLEKPDVLIQQEEVQNIKQSKIQNIMQNEVRKKKQARNVQKISLSAQAYNQIEKNVIGIFIKQKKQRMQYQDIQNQIKLTQGNVINYIVSLEMDKDTIQNLQHEKNFRKVVRGVLKKMIKQERMLMIEEDNQNQNERILKLHPNLNIQI